MKVYYVGQILETDSNNYNKCKIRFATFNEFILGYYNSEDLRLTIGDFNYLKSNLSKWRNTYSKIEDKKLIDIIDKSDIRFTRDSGKNYFIFEIVEDINGYYYGKELLTNLLFPITWAQKENIEYYYNRINDNRIEKIYIFENPNISRFRFIVLPTQVASKNMLNEELSIPTKNLKFKRHCKKINKYYNENIFNKEIILKEDKELEKQNEITKLMEDIEYSLSMLKTKNKELYLKYKEKYQNLCNENNNNPISLDDLKSILSDIKLFLSAYEEKCDNIIDYLNIITNRYLDKMLNNETDYNININDLNTLNETFLKSKNDYTIFEQRSFINKIALLYLLVAKENINNLNESNLENSYFKENAKSIILNLITLKDLEIIKSNFNNDELKDTSISNILNMIKKLEFNKLEKDQIKQLIK